MRLAGIDVVDSKLVSESIDFARSSLSPYLFNHVMRSWLLATILATRSEVKPDPEVLACAAVLHDLGLTEKYDASERFEVDGANAARSFLKQRGMGAGDLQLVWDAIALHTTHSIALHKEPEVAACCGGISIDIVGIGIKAIEPKDLAAINAAYPRLAIKEQFKDAMCGLARRKPQTTYDNFVRDFGERYVEGYKAPSGADALQNAPYQE